MSIFQNIRKIRRIQALQTPTG